MNNKDYKDLLLNQTTDLIWMIDLQFRLVYANKAYLNLIKEVTGVEKELNSSVFVEGFGEGYVEKWKAYYQRTLTGESFTIEENFFHPIHKKLQYLRISFSPIMDDNGNVQSVACRNTDVTTQKNAELEKELLAKITTCFKEEKLSLAGKALCETIQEFDDFDLVELWCPNLEQTYLTRIATATLIEGFDNLNNSISQLSKDHGLPGKVWKQEKQQLWDDKKISKYFLRKEAAEKADLKYLLGIPLTHQNKVTGVLLIGTKNNDRYLSRFSKLLKNLETLIGSEIKSKRLQDDIKHLYEAVPEILCITDFKGRILKINPAGCKLLGYSEDEILLHLFNDFVHPEDRDISTKELEKLQKGATAFGFENRYVTKNNKVVWLSWHCNSSAKDGLIYAAAKNITEEKIQREISLQVDRLAKIGGWQLDLNTMTPYFSKEVYKIHEIPVGSPPKVEEGINFYAPEARPIIQNAVAQAIENNTPYELELPFITAKDKKIWVKTYGKAEIIDGKAVRLYGAIQDITKQKEAESRLQGLSDNIPGVVFQYLLHPDGSDEFTYVSKGSEKIWGYSPKEVAKNIDLAWNLVKAGGDYEAVKQSISESVENKSQWSMRFRIVRADGEKRMLQGLGTPEFLGNGTVQFSSVMLDITEESKNQELLEDVEKLNKIGSWEVNLIQNTIYWSDQTHRIHETNPSTFQPKIIDKAINFYREDYRDLVRSKLEECMITGEAYDIEAVIITTTGKERWVRTTGKAEIVNGVSTRVYGSFQDITEQKIAEEELTSLTERLQVATEAASIGIWDWNIPQNKLVWDENMYAIYNVKPTEFNGAYEAWEAAIHPDDKEQASKDIENAINGVSEFDSSFRIIWKDKSVHYVKANALIERDKNGQALRMVGTNLDITKEKITEQQVTLALQEKNNILESIGDAFFAVDKNWIITYWNQRAESVMGRKREDIIGQNLWDVYHDATDLEFYQQYHLAMKTGEKVNFEEFYPALNLWLDVSVYPSKEGLSIYFRNVTQRKKSEEERNNLQKTLENSLNEIYMFDSDTLQFNYINKGALRNLGYSATDTKKLTLLDIKPEYTLSSFRKLITPLLLNEKERIIFFTKHQRKDGTLYPVEVHLQLIEERNNKNFVAIILDITERKKNKELLKQTTELARIGSWEVDLRKNTIYWSDMVHQLHGTDPNSFVPDLETAIDFYREDFREMVNQHIANSVKTGESWDFEAVLVDTNTQEVWVRAIGEPEFIDTECVRLFGSFQDITEIKTMELRLKSLSDDLPGVSFQYRVSPEGEDSRHLTSKASYKIWGVSPEESERNVDIVWDQIKKGGDFEKVQESIEKSMKSGEKWHCQWRNLHPSGELRWHEGFGTPSYLPDGTIVFNSMIFDITQRKHAELKLLNINKKLKTQTKELERSNQELEQFAFITSHDLQEPLRMITGFLGQLERKYTDALDDNAKQYIHYAKDGAKRMKQIILDLLYYSRINKPTEQQEAIKLNEIVSEYLLLRRKLIADKKAVIKYDTLPELHNFKAPVTQLFHCLLDNALKYSREQVPPEVTIQVKDKGTLWKFAIKDNGMGIEDQFYEKVFIIFQRLQNRKENDGTGIGLAITKRAVEFLGGKIWVESKVGKGSTFYFTIPKK